jgi:hypothetical protein
METMSKEDKTYNGWTNYETWLVNLAEIEALKAEHDGGGWSRRQFKVLPCATSKGVR